MSLTFFWFRFIHCFFLSLSLSQVVEQKRDLERITIYEIALNNDRRDYQQDLPQTENVRIFLSKKNLFRFCLGSTRFQSSTCRSTSIEFKTQRWTPKTRRYLFLYLLPSSIHSINLAEENTRIYSTWACELCTYLNEPYSVTRKDVCEMCEGPSPLKRRKINTIVTHSFSSYDSTIFCRYIDNISKDN